MDQNDRLDKFGIGDFREVAETIGVESALKLAEVFGGTTLAIPKLSAMKREERDMAIRKAYDAGKTVKTLSRHHNISTRQIANILNRKP